MKIVDDDINKEDKKKPNYVALGSFDGLHYGHLSLLRKTVEISKKNNGNSMVFTYKNHPKTLINPDKVPKLIMDIETKIKCLEQEGIDIVVFKEFTKEFMQIGPEEFIKMLCEKYNVKGIVVGFNFKFGYRNLGDINLLESLKDKYGYELFVMEPYTYKDDIISSSRIRKAISDGEVKEAFKMLSRYYSIKGEIIHGKKLGRTIGFPTANLKVNYENIIPKKGVYYTNVEYNNKIYKGITSVGNNPTVNGKELTIETFILDFKETIYEKEIRLYFINRMRDEIKFNNLDELINQLKKDEAYAKSRDIEIKIM